MEPLRDERTLHETEDRRLTVTTHRVRVVHRGLGRTGRVASVLLEDLDGIEFGRERRPLFLQFAGLALVAGFLSSVFFEDSEAFIVLGVFPALAFVAAYLIFRKTGLRLHAGRLTIHLPRFRGGVLAAESLIDLIERARLDRASAVPGESGPRFTGWRERASAPTSGATA